MKTTKIFRYILLFFMLLCYTVVLGKSDPQQVIELYQKVQTLFEQGKYSNIVDSIELDNIDMLLFGKKNKKYTDSFRKKLDLCRDLKNKINPSDSTALWDLYETNPSDPIAREYIKRQYKKQIADQKSTIIALQSDTAKLKKEKNDCDSRIDSVKSYLKIVEENASKDSARIEKVTEERDKAKSENDKLSQQHKKILNVFYSYNDSIALALKQDENQKIIYYFVDKEGNEIKKLEEWDNAEPFNANFVGYAKVKRKEIEYLIDTFGNKERYGKQFLQEITALDLTGNNYSCEDDPIHSFPTKPLEEVFNDPTITNKIKILNLHKTGICEFPPPRYDKEFSSLEYLDLSDNPFGNHNNNNALEGLNDVTKLKCLILRNCNIKKLPIKFTQLKNLTYLDIRGNDIDKGNLRSTVEKLIENKVKKLTLRVDIKQKHNLDDIGDKYGKDRLEMY